MTDAANTIRDATRIPNCAGNPASPVCRIGLRRRQPSAGQRAGANPRAHRQSRGRYRRIRKGL